MKKARYISGLVAGVFLILSSVMHTFLGTKSMNEELARTNSPAELVLGLRAGWVFGGVAMFALGCIVISSFAAALKDRSHSLRPVLLIGVLYSAYSVWAFYVSSFDLFFLMFLIPGVLLTICSIGDRPAE